MTKINSSPPISWPKLALFAVGCGIGVNVIRGCANEDKTNITPQTEESRNEVPDKNGVFFGTQARSISVSILPTGAPAAVSAQTSILSNLQFGGINGAPVGPHYTFKLPLRLGSRNFEVTNLQTFLALNIEIYPEGSVTGYFGPATTRAVKRLQEKYGLAKKGDDGYGNVGPKTRAKLNSIQIP